jgi:intergrase/recombinase
MPSSYALKIRCYQTHRGKIMETWIKKARETRKIRKRYWRTVTKIWLSGDSKLAAEMMCAVVRTVPKGREKVACKKAARLLMKAEIALKAAA